MLQQTIDEWTTRQGLGTGDAGSKEWVNNVERTTQVIDGLDVPPTPVEDLQSSLAQSRNVATHKTRVPIKKLAQLLDHGRMLEERLSDGSRTGKSVASLHARVLSAIERLEERLLRLFLVAKWTREDLESGPGGDQDANQDDIRGLAKYLAGESEKYKARAAEEVLLSE